MQEVAVVTSADKQLRIVYSKMEAGLYQSFSSDERMADFISRDPEEAFSCSVYMEDERIFGLNIASTEDFGYFEWEQMPKLLESQLSMFMPIIQKFILYAAIGRL